MNNSQIDEQWTLVLNDSDEHIRRIAARASREPVLRQLYPYVSMSNLRFSRTSEYPYDPLPYVLTAAFSARYEARDANHRPLAEGDLESVIPAVVRAIQAMNR